MSVVDDAIAVQTIAAQLRRTPIEVVNQLVKLGELTPHAAQEIKNELRKMQNAKRN